VKFNSLRGQYESLNWVFGFSDSTKKYANNTQSVYDDLKRELLTMIEKNYSDHLQKNKNVPDGVQISYANLRVEIAEQAVIVLTPNS
jgi:hypothetical protein